MFNFAVDNNITDIQHEKNSDYGSSDAAYILRLQHAHIHHFHKRLISQQHGRHSRKHNRRSHKHRDHHQRYQFRDRTEQAHEIQARRHVEIRRTGLCLHLTERTGQGWRRGCGHTDRAKAFNGIFKTRLYKVQHLHHFQ